MANEAFMNPFKPGAGHTPPHLAGRHKETEEFLRLLKQKAILENMVLTGLRGVGKTVLLERFKSLAIKGNWLWTGTDLSESASVSEESLAMRLITDLSLITSSFVYKKNPINPTGFSSNEGDEPIVLNYNQLVEIFRSTPGLIADKLKAVLETAWETIRIKDHNGIIFAYDEAQTISDQEKKEQYPVALLLDIFQSIQRKGIPFMLVLTGLPTLAPKLVESRTFAERMFRIVFLKRLSKEESREAIRVPIDDAGCPIKFTDESVELIIDQSGGYPYFIQFMCKEIYDIFIQQHAKGETATVPMHEIVAKLDIDFFAGRWAKATDRQRQLLAVAAKLPTCADEFTVAELVVASKNYNIDPFSGSQVNQMLTSLANAGLIYKNRYGKYSFAVPLLNQFIDRQNILTES